MKKNTGFTLIELIVVVAIIGIIASIAIPSYTEYVQDSYRSEAQSALLQFGNAMERRYTEGSPSTYMGAGTDANDNSDIAPAATVFASQAPLDRADKFYNLTIQIATASTFTLKATPIAGTSAAGDGALLVDSSGNRCWDEGDDAETSATAGTCTSF